MKVTRIIINLLSFLLILILQNYLIVHAIYTSLKQYLKVSERELPDLLANEEILIKGNRLLTPLLDESSFGGSYIDIKANKININIVDSSKKNDIMSNPVMEEYLNLLSFKKISNSLDKLNAALYELHNMAKRYNATNLTISNEYEFNKIVLYLNVNDYEKNKAFIDDAEKLYPNLLHIVIKAKNKISFNLSSSSFALKTRDIKNVIFGGDGLVTESGDQCTAGFWMRQDNFTFLVTAGHCARDATHTPDGNVRFYYYPSPPYLVGEMTYYEYEGVDRGFILVNNSDILVVPNIKNVGNDTYRELFIIGTVDIDTVGSHICIAGANSHVSCGKVTAINMVADIRGFGKFGGVINTDIVCQDGDSGGPAFQFKDRFPRYVYLAGILIAGEGNLSIIEPLNKLLDDDMIPVRYNPNLFDFDTPP
ncbi:7446_t:CDS:1 [Cetraspora pellucida]|uniref:7446_t:CDS:1 n=1 Tax=Cetraspora pellucida TaxID=1433469 RepID=A0A9N9NEK2_9GLOM|nr:7446_t:CDS:1 [Cetraspora pellucida]